MYIIGEMGEPKKFEVNFDEIDDCRDHLERVADWLESSNGDILVHYTRPTAEQREQQRKLEEEAYKKREIARLKRELAELEGK